MSTSTSTPEIVAWVGLDWADQQHVGRLQAHGSSRVESFVLNQKPEALQAWVQQLRTRFPQGAVAIALEQSRGPLLYALMNYDFLVLYPVPSQSLALYRRAFYPGGGKDDPVDADLLLDFLLKHPDRLRPWLPDNALTRQIRLLVEHRRKLIADRTRLTNRLTAALKEYFPQALEWAGELASLAACEFLRRWPTLEALQQAPRRQRRNFYRAHRRLSPQELEQRLAHIDNARPLTSDLAVIQTSALMVSVWVEQLRCLMPALDRLEATLQQLFQQHPDHEVFDSFPGAGAALAPRLLAAFGSDRQRFQDAVDVQCFSGIAPVTQRSGKTCWVHWRWACPKFVRQSFHEFAAASRFWSPWANTYYQQLRGRGSSHHGAVRALAFKWIRILYRCWKDRTLYNEHRYQQALQRRASPLGAALALLTTQEVHL